MRTHSRRLTQSIFFSPPLGIPAGRILGANRPARLQRVGSTFNHTSQAAGNQSFENQPTPATTTAAVDPPDNEDGPQEVQFDDEETESVEEQIEQNRDAGVVTNPPFLHPEE